MTDIFSFLFSLFLNIVIIFSFLYQNWCFASDGWCFIFTRLDFKNFLFSNCESQMCFFHVSEKQSDSVWPQQTGSPDWKVLGYSWIHGQKHYHQNLSFFHFQLCFVLCWLFFSRSIKFLSSQNQFQGKEPTF